MTVKTCDHTGIGSDHISHGSHALPPAVGHADPHHVLCLVEQLALLLKSMGLPLSPNSTDEVKSDTSSSVNVSNHDPSVHVDVATRGPVSGRSMDKVLTCEQKMSADQLNEVLVDDVRNVLEAQAKSPVYSEDIVHAAMKNFRKFHGVYFEPVSLGEIEQSSLGVLGWAHAQNVIPAELDLTNTRREAMLDDEIAKTNEPNSEYDSYLSERVRAQMISKLHAHLGCEKVELLRSLGALEEIEQQFVPLQIVTAEDDDGQVAMVENWVDTDIELTLDSGCCEHVLDISDAPGYGAFITESTGSKRGQRFIVGNGERVPNDGEVRLNMQCGAVPLQSVFQVAGVTRPLMSVGRVCDQGMKCLFDDKVALVLNKDNQEVCRFERRGGLYVARLKLKSPELFPRPAK